MGIVLRRLRWRIAPLLATIGVACGESTTPRTNPPPQLSSVTPLEVDSGVGAELEVLGTFIPSSIVRVKGVNLPTTYKGASHLIATLAPSHASTPGPMEVTVVNPPPGGGTSNATTIFVRHGANPIPTITQSTPLQLTAGSPSTTLTLIGTNFIPASLVFVGQDSRPVTFVSQGQLQITLQDTDVAASAVLNIRVVNPAPGGGESNSFAFQVVSLAPVLALLPSRGAHAGKGGFDLWVHGRNFDRGSVVRWNGSPRPTQFVSHDRLIARIGNADVALPGSAQVSVSTPPPGGGTSTSVLMTIRSLAATTSFTKDSMLVYAADMVLDRQRNRLYVSVGSTAPVNPNRILALDPVTKSIAQGVFIGSNPGRLALSDDGSTLYVGIDGVNAVRRVNAPSLVPGVQWPLPPANRVAYEMFVLRGQPNSVAIVKQIRDFSGARLEGMAVYDDTIPRPVETAAPPRFEVLEAPDTIYGDGGNGWVRVLALSASGLHGVRSDSVFEYYESIIAGASGRLYASVGSIVDAGRNKKVGAFVFSQPDPFPSGTSAMAIDADLGRAFAMVREGLKVMDLNTLQEIGLIPIWDLDLVGPVLRHKMIRWSADGLLLLRGNNIYMLRSPLFAP